MPTVTIGGEEPEAIFSVDDAGRTDDIGESTIEVGSTDSNRELISSGAKVVIERAGGDDWHGYVTGRPERTNDGKLEVKALDTRYELNKREVNRVFYDMDSGEIVREAVQYEADGRGQQDVHNGDTTTGWESDASIFELAALQNEQPHEKGSDMLFVGLRDGSSGSYYARFTDVPDRAIPGDGQILRLDTRLLVNDAGSQIDVEIELRDNAGNQYVWAPELSRTDFTVLELNAEDADSDGDLETDGTLEYRFNLSGDLSDNTGIAIDWAETYPFVLEGRETDITVNNVETTDRNVTRRFDKSALELVQDLQVEDGFKSWIDGDDDLHYENAGGEASNLEIIRGETAVTAATFDTDYDAVTNRVTIKGSDDVQVTLEDSASIEYYGVSARSEPIVDEELQTDAEAEDRGRGFLEENAWDDTVAEFTIANTAFQQISQGESVYVSWPPQTLEGFFMAEDVSVDNAGRVTVNLGVRV